MSQIRGLQSNFWIVNWLEANERLAFFGVRAIAPLYMIASIEKNGLALSYSEKGLIYSIWALVQCLVPMVSGGFTDEYGYKKSLYVAFSINIIGNGKINLSLCMLRFCKIITAGKRWMWLL